MGATLELGKRIELVPMDPHFHDITIGLYRQDVDGNSSFRVHTYSGIDGVRRRIAFVVQAMEVLGGMQPVESDALILRFPCGSLHNLAARRVFLEACKLNPVAALESRKLSIYDRKSDQNITATNQGAGVYDLAGDGSDAARVAAVTGGLLKLGEMLKQDSSGTRVAFACGRAHDALTGLLLVRALNVRAILREEEMAATRGVLVAPSAQK